MENSDIIIIGGGAAGLMAAYGAAKGNDCTVLVLEKMPRPGRKIMLTGKGRCNYSNIKDWGGFSAHIRSKANFVRTAFYELPPERMMSLLAENGLETEVQRGDRAYPASMRAMDLIDTLTDACRKAGARMETYAEVGKVTATDGGFLLETADGVPYSCKKLVIATGGLSYPRTGSSGDGYAWAKGFGHKVTPLFPSLTALVPKGYKQTGGIQGGTGRMAAEFLPGRMPSPREVKLLPDGYPEPKGHIDWAAPLSELGRELCGVYLRNTGVSLSIGDDIVREEFGDVEFTDGGLEGPIGFTISRDAVKAITNGSKVAVTLNLKNGVPPEELQANVSKQLAEILHDPRSDGRRLQHVLVVLLDKLLPRAAIHGFQRMHPKLLLGNHIDTMALCEALQGWRFEIAGFVGYERCVVTAGGVSTDEVSQKTMESRLHPGLYFAGEVLDMDSDTGGYNLQTAFSTGFLAGRCAAASLSPRT